MSKNRMLFGWLAGACVAAAAGSAALADDIYRNDFSTRTSAAAIPSGAWRQQDYVTGLLANTNYDDPFANTHGVQRMQDGWIKDHVYSSPDNASIANASIYSDNGNNMAVLGNGPNVKAAAVIVKQRIGNVFTNGIVTVQFDFVPPNANSWPSFTVSDRRVFLSVGDEDYYSPESDRSFVFNHTAANVGIIFSSGRKVFYRSQSAVTTDKAVTASAWHRAVVDIDLDARTCGFSMYELGMDHPDHDTATPETPVYATNNIAFNDDAVKSISSIGLCAYGVVWNSSGNESEYPDRSARFDNIRIAHDGEECYVNSFTERKSRSLAAGTTSAMYEADCAVTNLVSNDLYPVPKANPGISLVPAKVANNSAVEPVGVDGWRRVIQGSSSTKDNEFGDVQLYKNETTGNDSALRLAKNTETGVACPIGSTISNGIVRLVADMRVPGSVDEKTRLWVSLGSDTLYNGYRDQCKGGRIVHAGIGMTDTTCGHPRYVKSDGQSFTGSDIIKTSTWYRIELKVNLDTDKFDFTLYEQGANRPTIDAANGTEVFADTNISRMNGGNTITTFALWSIKAITYFDSIRIWHTPPGATEEVVLYRNSFMQRTVCPQGKKMGTVTGTIRLNPEGQDHWKAVSLGNKCANIMDGEDPALSFSGGSSGGYAVHELGQTINSGTLVAQVDMRPPCGWRASDGSVYLRLGGDMHYEGGLAGDLNFLNWVAAGFGFKNLGDAQDANMANAYTNVTFVAMQGNGTGGGSMISSDFVADPSHWYRLIAKAQMRASKYDVELYDMGTEHPTLATATPAAPVATLSDLTFRHVNDTLGGVSCVSVSAANTYWTELDTRFNPYVDNIVVTAMPSGMCIIVR